VFARVTKKKTEFHNPELPTPTIGAKYRKLCDRAVYGGSAIEPTLACAAVRVPLNPIVLN